MIVALNPRAPLQAPTAEAVARDVVRALEEDIGSGDVTAALVEPGNALARIVSKDPETAVLAGTAWAEACFRALDASVRMTWQLVDGDRFDTGAVLCEIEGAARALLSAERAALNFLQTLSATATTTRAFVDAVAGTGCRILDTRKTLPGLRYAQKYAVRAGGGTNHRAGLFDAVLIKENHIAAAGSIGAAVARARQLAPGLMVEVEVENSDELEAAIASGADRVMLDEFSEVDRARAVRIAAGRVALEVSGNVSLADVRAVAQSGVDFVSIGALTKHVRAIDLSMRFVDR